MTISPTVIAQKAVIAALKADAAVTALVAAGSIYPPKTPTGPMKPFIRYGSAGAEPERLSGIRGGVVSAAVHVFVGVTDTIPDPGQFAGDVTDAMAEAIDAIDNAFVERSQVMPDALEPDVVHGIVWFQFTAAEFT